MSDGKDSAMFEVLSYGPLEEGISGRIDRGGGFV